MRYFILIGFLSISFVGFSQEDSYSKKQEEKLFRIYNDPSIDLYKSYVILDENISYTKAIYNELDDVLQTKEGVVKYVKVKPFVFEVVYFDLLNIDVIKEIFMSVGITPSEITPKTNFSKN